MLPPTCMCTNIKEGAGTYDKLAVPLGAGIFKYGELTAVPDRAH